MLKEAGYKLCHIRADGLELDAMGYLVDGRAPSVKSGRGGIETRDQPKLRYSRSGRTHIMLQTLLCFELNYQIGSRSDTPDVTPIRLRALHLAD